MKIGVEAGRRRIVTVELIPDRANPAELSLLRGRLDAVTLPALRNESDDPTYPTSFTVTPQKRSLASASIVRRSGIEVIPSLTCRDCRREDLRIVARMVEEGLENFLVVYGDRSGDDRDRYEFARTDRLIRQVSSATRGHASLGAITNQYARRSVDEVSRTLARVDAGADFVLTNMCFSQEGVLRHRDELRSAGLDVPLIIQVSIPHSIENLLFVSRKFGLPVSEELVGKLRRDRWAGISVAAETFELLRKEANGIHFSYLLRKRNPIPVYSRLLERIRTAPLSLSVPIQGVREVL